MEEPGGLQSMGSHSEMKDVQGCDLLQMQIPHLCGPAAGHSCYWTACEEWASWVNA